MLKFAVNPIERRSSGGKRNITHFKANEVLSQKLKQYDATQFSHKRFFKTLDWFLANYFSVFFFVLVFLCRAFIN